MLKWTEGRQKSGYLKLTLFSSALLKRDLHILKFIEGSYVNTHVDKAPYGYEHHRLNIVLRKASKGGIFTKNNEEIHKRIIKFRPDIEPHSVSPIRGKTRYVLSFGWIKKKRITLCH